MTDEIDRAQLREEQDRQMAIEAARKSAEESPYIGQCYNCQTSTPPGVRFCDTDCRQDWQRRRSAEARRGVVQGAP